MNRLIKFLFYGSYFYGCCAVALLWETITQLELNIQEPLLYFCTFGATVIFYNYPYFSKPSTKNTNPRVRWIAHHHRSFLIQQVLLAGITLLCLVLLFAQHAEAMTTISPYHFLLFIIPLLLAVSYYSGLVGNENYNLRKIGWLKPFIIGLVWTGLVFVYPILFVDITQPGGIAISFFMLLLFIKSVMFISILAILFDIKDAHADRNLQMETFIVRLGLRKTLFYLVLPLTLLGLLTFFTYAIIQGMTGWRIILILIPFILLLGAIYSLRKEKSLLYYLIVIDGLMLVKAICGGLAMQV